MKLRIPELSRPYTPSSYEKACSRILQRLVNTMTAFVLRIIALLAMLIDHLYSRLFPDQIWMHCIGRIAFPLFAFQLTNGYQHTRNKGKYVLRLLLFALLSEIPFDLMLYSKPLDWGHQNVMWTLLLGLLVIWITDCVLARWRDPLIRICALVCVVITASAAAAVLRLDYGGPGILLIFAFYILRSRSLLVQFPVLLCITALMSGPNLSLGSLAIPIPLFALASLLLIRFYNHRPGPHSKGWQWFCYGFYPLHMLILALI